MPINRMPVAHGGGCTDRQPVSILVSVLELTTTLLIRDTKRLVLVNICSVESNSAGICVSKVSPGIFVIKAILMHIIFGGIKPSFSGCDKSRATIFVRQISAAKFVE